MEKFYFVVIIVIAVILGIVTIFTQNKSFNNTQDLIIPSPTDKSANELQIPSVQKTQPTITPTPATTVPENLWVTTASSAAIKTVRGEIDIQLYAQDTPKTVTNFATLSKIGYYNNLTFHRVEDWVIQGGDPNGDGTGGISIYGPTFEDELNPNTPSFQVGYKAGIVAMANRGPNTNGSQFFILKQDYPLQHNYTIFGKVTNGMDIVGQIQKGDKILSIVIQ